MTGTTAVLADPTPWCARFLAPMNAHDPDVAASFYTEDGAWEFTAGPDPWGTNHAGRPAIRQAIADICREVPDIHYELLSAQAGPGHIVMEVLVTGSTRAGARLRYHACDVVTLAGELVAAKRSYRKVVS
ncbi:MAG TPA: nuclear transport factor 2 family protein [Pseudonocardia sp.]|jgi:ketosteroid isomerase-like protein